MVRRIITFGACVLTLLFVVHPVKADGMATEKFSYTADFGKNDAVQFYASNGKDYAVNFKGITDEETGKKCFKLDVTFGSDPTYIYWSVPMPKPVPAEGSLKFTGRVFLGEGTTATRVEIGPTYSYPPSFLRGTCPEMYRATDKGKWFPVQGNLVEIATRYASVMDDCWGGAELSNAGRCLDAMLIRLYGNKGDRVVIYLDDFKVEGEVPASDGYNKEAEKRWAPIREKLDKKTDEWADRLDQDARVIDGVAAKTDAVIKMKQESLSKITALKTRVANTKCRGALRACDYQEIEGSIKQLDEIASNLASR